MNPVGTIHEETAIRMSRALSGERQHADALANKLDCYRAHLNGKVTYRDATDREYLMWAGVTALMKAHNGRRAAL